MRIRALSVITAVCAVAATAFAGEDSIPPCLPGPPTEVELDRIPERLGEIERPQDKGKQTGPLTSLNVRNL